MTSEEMKEYQHLYAEHVRLSQYALDVLARYGMDSKEFHDADAATIPTWKRMRELQGMAGEHWMA